MPVTETYYPILSHFLCSVQKTTGMPAAPVETPHDSTSDGQDIKAQPLPKGVVLGPDGKPCRTCTSVKSWMQMTKSADKAKTPSSAPPAQSATSVPQLPEDCPPDVEQLGRSSWTLLHTIAANYPEQPTFTQQSEARQFVSLFGKLYPCWVCASDFQDWMKSGHEPRVSSRDEFGRWMCEAHNAVNEKLGKSTFDCNRWQERWRTGWKDGRCG
ncbi:mitochondrial FAD-linked sulfhydryl oxidase ERV1 [Elsinoe australis]|uniref:Sulfhydryl oxidase n=1 Tax=Elsinoe australis TaxID=40998 RepID=A0A4U7B2U9_9PEZI|nr:mitochondrial FAD-linked sulfhydryl oxidase ERV1 [Elsinoe australis]